MTIPPFIKRLMTLPASARNDTSWSASKRSHRIKRWFSSAAERTGPWLAVLAFNISLGSFTVASWQYLAVTRHYRLSVRPQVVITFTLEGDMDGKNGIYFANLGLGPAIVKALSIEVGGKSYDAMDKGVWRNVFRDLTIVPGCFRQSWTQSGSALKTGEELALLTLTHAKPPVVDGYSCPIELLKLLKAEGLKVRMQYESMYGEPHEAIGESWIDSDTISEIEIAMLQQIVPKLVEQLQGQIAQVQQMADQMADEMQQVEADTKKHFAEFWEQKLLEELYEDPPGAPPDWWVPK
jgi:hypothetical protein